MISKATELRLIRKARAGDGEAIEALIRAHQDALFAFILRLSGHPDVAEDIVQEAFVRVLKNLDRFDSRFRFSTWLFTIAKRLYVNSMQKHRPAYDTDTVASRQGAGPTPAAVAVRHEITSNIRGVLDAAMGALNPQQREIIILYHHRQWGIIDISRHLGMPEGTVKSHLHRARKRMRREIAASDSLESRAREVWS